MIARPLLLLLLLLLAAAVLAGCSTRPVFREARDGPGTNPPSDLAQRPDAQPRVEPLRSGGPNKPYEVLGQRHVPLTGDLPLNESGGASWYGRKFHGQPTASGEIYDMYAMTAAHKTMPIPSYALVRNPANGREVVVRVNDRGPFVGGRVIDLSYTAALKLGLLGGVAPVQVQRLTFADIRAGSWRRDSVAALAPDDPAPGDPLEAASGVWLQLGSYRSREAAHAMLQRALFEADVVVQVQPEGPQFRVLAGPFEGREQARQAADRLRRLLGVSALLIER